MKSFVLIAVFCLFIKAQASDQTKAAEVKVIVVNNITDYIQSNPNATLIPMKMSRQARLNQNWYTLGARSSGDRLVAINNGWAQYPSKQNVELSIWYPTSGVGAILTYVQILMTQDTGTYGRGYVTAGGIGQRFIQIVVEAWNTAYVRYDYSLFGI
jgi:hypothetical protein